MSTKDPQGEKPTDNERFAKLIKQFEDEEAIADHYTAATLEFIGVIWRLWNEAEFSEIELDEERRQEIEKEYLEGRL